MTLLPKLKSYVARSLSALALSTLALVAPSAAQAKDVAIYAGQLIDGVSQTPRKNVTILIKNDRIVSVSDGFTAPEGVEVIDLSKSTVLPGLIDCHVHLQYDMVNKNILSVLTRETMYQNVLSAAVNARKTLLAGFTSVRDVGGAAEVVVALKKSIAVGETVGPRMWVSGGILGPTGGHADYRNGFDPNLSKPEWTQDLVDSPDDAVKAVRQHHRMGTDLIKIVPSGGLSSDGDDPHAQLMTDAEIKAVVDTAHALGMKVAAHAHGRGAINHAAELGVDSIEHGTFADETSFKIMKQKGTYFVPTLLVTLRNIERLAKRPELLSPSAVAKLRAVGDLRSRTLAAAYRAGVKIAFGTDPGGAFSHGQNADEFALLVRAGMTPMDAIISATSTAAALLGAPNDVGSIQPGRYADIIATKGDPLKDITELQRVAFVMKGGVVAAR